MDMPPAIYAEAEVPAFQLPALLDRNEALLALGETVYGIVPAFEWETTATRLDEGALQGDAATRREQWQVNLRRGEVEVAFELLVFLPAQATGPVPVFLGLNFDGNHTTNADPAIRPPSSWHKRIAVTGVREGDRVAAGDRGRSARRWPVSLITGRGYGVATVYCGDFAPDDPGHWQEGVARLWAGRDLGSPPGAVAAWAWGLSRAREALARHPDADPARIAVIGHSRLGKAALWAGAQDDAFALVVSNDSGCGGAALSRRRFGERLVHINTRFPHWFTPAFHAFNEREHALPVDQHQVLGAVAPRLLHVASASEDQWADPRGEYLSLAAAAPQWALALPPEPPGVGQVLAKGNLAYHCRAGRHDITVEDWSDYLDFADRHLRRSD